MTSAEDIRRQLLVNAGLEPLGPVATPGLIEPDAAWKKVSSLSTVPTLVLDADHPEEIDRGWREVAESLGVISSDGVVLISVTGTRLPWERVRLTSRTNMAGIVECESDTREFVAAAVDGHALCAVTCDEDDIWIVGVDVRIGDE
jgi:hypothetical protein